VLYRETVEPRLLELIQQLCQQPELDGFLLVGGTALSLQLGHRQSIDIDLFSAEAFDVEEMVQFLQKRFQYFNQMRFKNSLLGNIGNIKLDIISHQYRWLYPSIEIEGIRMAGLEDIAAMKLNAIMGNGSRLKDYVDIAYMSSCFSLQQMLDFFETKYPQNNSMMAFKSLSWFNDINFDVDIRYVNNKMNWEKIHHRVIEMVQQPEIKFKSL